jgi:hypothetical protein
MFSEMFFKVSEAKALHNRNICHALGEKTLLLK